MFEDIFGKFNGGPGRGGNNAISDFAKILEEKDAEIKRLKELILVALNAVRNYVTREGKRR